VISFFKSQQPATILAFLLFFCFIKIPFFLLGNTIPIAKIDNFWSTVGIIVNNHFLINFLLAQICLLIQAIWFNYLFHKADYNEHSTMIPALYFTLITSLIPQFNQFSIYIIIGFILLAIFQTLLTITTKDSAKADSFNLGILGGILVIVNAHFLFFLPFLFLMLYSVKPFRINEYLMLLFGIFSPFYFAISISYLLDYGINVQQFLITSVSIFKFERDILNSIVFITTAFFVLMSFVSLRGIMYSTGFKRRKNVNMLIFFFIGMVITILFSNDADETVLSFLFIPISVFLTLFMLRMRNRKWTEIFNAIFVFVTFITNIIRVFK
jgi:hypothetical protein